LTIETLWPLIEVMRISNLAVPRPSNGTMHAPLTIPASKEIAVLAALEGDALVCALKVAWNRRETFAMEPERGGTADWLAAALDHIPERRRCDHFLLQTSGSTGRPKLVVGCKRRAEQLARVLHEVQENEPVRETILCLPLSYSFAFVNQWVWAHVFNREIVPTDGLRDATTFGRRLERADHAMLCLVGSQVPLLQRYLGNREFPGVLRVNFAGSRFPVEQLDVLKAMFPAAMIFNNYGCAEALPRLTVRAAEAYLRAEQIGFPLPGVTLRQAADQALEFRSSYQAVGLFDEQGYYEPGADDWLKTGDRAEQAADGSWELLGRESHVFKRYGEKVSLQIVRDALQPCVEGQLAFYEETDRAGEPGYVLVLAPAQSDGVKQALLRTIRKEFRRPLWPLRIETVEAFPLTTHGKIDTESLRTVGSSVVWKQHL
jgi:acyl-coenzyme A synthetase/AMP-(fatty) acid ligase